MYELLGISVMLAALLLINAAASLVTAFTWQLATPLVASLSARTRSELLFTLRLAAPALALVAVCLFIIPSYIDYEPRTTTEVVSKKLAALAIVSLVSIGFALWRTIRAWRATAALSRDWLAKAERIEIAGIELPAFRIP